MALDTANALVSLVEAKTFLKISASSEDSVIEDFINRASIWANDYTGRRLKLRSNSDTYDGDGSDLLLLRDYPLSGSLTDLRIDDGTYQGSPPSTTSDDYTLNSQSGLVKLKNGVTFVKGFQNITATYTAGYTTPPETVKEAVLLYVGHLYRRQYADQKFGVQSETVGDRTTTYGSDDIIPKAKALLNPYRSERVLFSGF